MHLKPETTHLHGIGCDVDLILANSEAVSAAFYADTNTDQWSWATRGASYSPGGDEPVGERNIRSIPQDVKVAVSARDGGKCRLCGSTEDIQFDC